VKSPFLNLNRSVFPGEIHILASHVVWVEISQSRTTMQLVLGLPSGHRIESLIFEPTEATLQRLREIRDEILDDLRERLQVQADDKPAYAPLPAGD
jgi:hypothetical protein